VLLGPPPHTVLNPTTRGANLSNGAWRVAGRSGLGASGPVADVPELAAAAFMSCLLAANV